MDPHSFDNATKLEWILLKEENENLRERCVNIVSMYKQELNKRCELTKKKY